MQYNGIICFFDLSDRLSRFILLDLVNNVLLVSLDVHSRPLILKSTIFLLTVESFLFPLLPQNSLEELVSSDEELEYRGSNLKRKDLLSFGKFFTSQTCDTKGSGRIEQRYTILQKGMVTHTILETLFFVFDCITKYIICDIPYLVINFVIVTKGRIALFSKKIPCCVNK